MRGQPKRPWTRLTTLAVPYDPEREQLQARIARAVAEQLRARRLAEHTPTERNEP